MDKILQKIINIVHDLHEEGIAVGTPPTNNASGGKIAGLPPDQPPVSKKKRYIYPPQKGLRKIWQNK